MYKKEFFINEDVMNAKAKKMEENVSEEDIINAEEQVNEDVVDVTESTQENVAEEENKLQEDYNKLKDDYIRLYAEMDNMRKRVQQENEKTIKFAVSSFAKELLGVADNLERAITAMENNKESCEELLKGVELTQNELTKVFEKFGIKRFNHMGQKFDPNFERVVQEIEDKKSEPGTIIAELQAGYVIYDRILREAMVIVSKG